MSDGTVTLSERQILDMVEEAATRAAQKAVSLALHDLGLHDEDAGRDMREIRSLIDSFRSAKRTIWTTIIKWVTTILLAGMIAAVGVNTGIVKVPG